jgi:hypothetical protein
MKPVLLVDVVGLTPRQIGERTPHLRGLAARGAFAPMTTVLPAVTCSAQATMLTGLAPREHGAVGNGWPGSRERRGRAVAAVECARLGRKLYERARRVDPSFRCAKIFWWWNLGAAVDYSITPRPFYPADGRKIPAVYASPRRFGEETEAELGKFPFFDFWGPKSGLPSSRWLADAAMRTLAVEKPTLTMVYLPHLDYDHQRYGPRDARSLRALEEIDAIVGELLAAAERARAEVMVVSEYGLCDVDTPVHVNRVLRGAGLLAARETPAGEVLDVFASEAFALADHQLAHVYVRSSAAAARAREILEATVMSRPRRGRQEGVWDRSPAGRRSRRDLEAARLVHLLLLDRPRGRARLRTHGRHPSQAPATTRASCSSDPALRTPRVRVALRLAQKIVGMRYLMDVIPLDATLVRGSHGRLPDDPEDGPAFLCTQPLARCGGEPSSGRVEMTSIPERVLALLCR